MKAEGGERMRRDMDFVRKLLIDISNEKCKTNFVRGSGEDEIYLYHLKIMKQAGFIEFNLNEHKSGAFLFDVPTLTWLGNDYLDAISNDTVWNKTKEGIKSKGLELGQISFEILKEYAKLELKKMLGIL